MVSPLSVGALVHRWPSHSPICAGLAMASGPRSAASARARDDARDGEPHGDASASRPNNAPGDANRGAPYQNADAFRSCSCRTLKLLTVWSALTRAQPSLRRACGRSVLDHIQTLSPPYIETIRKANLRSLKGEIWKPGDCKLCLILKDNMYVLLAAKITMPRSPNRAD